MDNNNNEITFVSFIIIIFYKSNKSLNTSTFDFSTSSTDFNPLFCVNILKIMFIIMLLCIYCVLCVLVSCNFCYHGLNLNCNLIDINRNAKHKFSKSLISFWNKILHMNLSDLLATSHTLKSTVTS